MDLQGLKNWCGNIVNLKAIFLDLPKVYGFWTKAQRLLIGSIVNFGSIQIFFSAHNHISVP